MNQPDRRRLQRGIIILPSAFTLGNLFFGVYAVVAALRGDFAWAGWFIVFAASLDLLDGRVARFTRTGSAFGAELDSLVDAVSFGMAPAMIMILLYFSDAGWSWVLGFVYVTAIVVRLARYNVEQGGEAKRHFHGLPSPTAGMILATHYPFSQTEFFQSYLATLPWPQIMGVTMVLISVLMLSHVPYAMVPRIDLRTPRGISWTILMALGIVLALAIPSYWFFPALVIYTVWGLLKSVFMGLLERLPERDPLLDTEDEEEETRQVDYADLGPGPHSNNWKEHTS
ncbi:MAG: CDP-diacylglycerol--serine O-phosphatidyltransferase [Gemmatimonadota bacterium]|nr:CDP-diacylglycerol--serine O-phosphatidyltransferase [Gemmatimonadota bacterium]